MGAVVDCEDEIGTVVDCVAEEGIVVGCVVGIEVVGTEVVEGYGKYDERGMVEEGRSKPIFCSERHYINMASSTFGKCIIFSEVTKSMSSIQQSYSND